MPRTICLIALAIVTFFITSDRNLQAAAPTTQPDLVAENALLKKMIAEDAIKNDETVNRLRDAEDQIAELHAKIRDLQQRLTSHSESAPNLPYRMQPLNPLPYTPGPDSNAGSFEFNGRTVYVLPVHAPALSIDLGVQTPTSSGASQVYQGITTIKRDKP